MSLADCITTIQYHSYWHVAAQAAQSDFVAAALTAMLLMILSQAPSTDTLFGGDNPHGPSKPSSQYDASSDPPTQAE